MADISVENLIPEMEAYKLYLSSQEHGKNAKALSNVKEDYKRGIAERAAQILNAEDWTSNEIGTGIIGERVFKAVDRNFNLVGRFQVRLFSSKIKEKNEAAEKVLFDLYHDHKEQECFEQICKLFGRKYDLVSDLYFILDSGRYLPLRSSIFDGVFTKIGIDLQTAGMCSWQNYQKYLSTVAEVRDAMKDYYHQEEVDLLDAHSFLWTIALDVLDQYKKEKVPVKMPVKEMSVVEGAIVLHKEYGEGLIEKLTDEKAYVTFSGKHRIFLYPEAFEKEYLKLR